MTLRHAAPAAWILVVGCTGFTSDENRPVAIEVVGPPTSIAVGETLLVETRALNRNGEVIAGVVPVLLSENPDTLGITDDSAGLIGRLSGPGRFRAQVSGSTLQTGIFPISVTPP